MKEEKERWLEVNFYGKMRGLGFLCLAKAITCKIRKEVKSYHVFFEPRPNFILRLELRKTTNLRKMKNKIAKIIREYREARTKYIGIKRFTWMFSSKYKGERKTYGCGWEIMKRYFNVSADYAMLKAFNYVHDLEDTEGREFVDWKVIHVIINNRGIYDMLGEVNLYSYLHDYWLLSLSKAMNKKEMKK